MELLIKKTCSHHNSFLLVLLIDLSQLHLLNLSQSSQGLTFFLEIDHTTKITFHMCHFLCLYCFLCCCIGQLKLEFSFLYYLAFVVLSLILFCGQGAGFSIQGSRVQNHWVAPSSTQPFILPRSIK